jgi:glycosyltransferase involved in cell wall biosynthesis
MSSPWPARPVLCLNLYATTGGAERALLELTSALDRSRFEPIVVLASDGPLRARLGESGVEVRLEPFPTPPLHALAWPPTLVRLARAAMRMRRLVRERQVRLAQCGDVLGLLVLVPAMLSGLRVVYQVNYLGHGPRLRLFGILARFVGAVVACSAWQRDAVVAAAASLASRTVVIHPGIDTAAFGSGNGAAVRQEWGVPAEAPLIGMLARYDVWKGHRTFLEAAVRVLERRPDARFAMIGGALNSTVLGHVGAYRRQILDELEALGLHDRVLAIDHRDDVPDVLAALEVVVLPSVDEPFGMVLIEAMAAGRPVVAADSGGPREIVQDAETGLLFRTGDAASLAAAILKLLDDAGLARSLADAGSRRARDAFHKNRYAREMEAVYDRFA